MATIGMETQTEEFSRAAIEAVEDILSDSRQWRTEEPLLSNAGEIGIGIGIAAGPVSFGAVGQNERLEMTVIGAPVNTSAKLEKHNKVLGSKCIVQREIWEQAIATGYSGNLKASFKTTKVEGIADPQEIAVLSL